MKTEQERDTMDEAFIAENKRLREALAAAKSMRLQWEKKALFRIGFSIVVGAIPSTVLAVAASIGGAAGREVGGLWMLVWVIVSLMTLVISAWRD